jgi:hypothetical protein
MHHSTMVSQLLLLGIGVSPVQCGGVCWHVMANLSFDCSSGCKVMQLLPLSLMPAAKCVFFVLRLVHYVGVRSSATKNWVLPV